MNNRTVVLDMDGGLADFEGAFCEQYGDQNRGMVSLTNRYPQWTMGITQFIQDPFTYKELKPLRIGLEIARYLNREGWEIAVVTARPDGTDTVTRDWLRKHGVEYASYYRNNLKTGHIINLRPFCAVDDLLSVYGHLQSENIPCLVVSQPWNNTEDENVPRISTLDEFIIKFGQIVEEYA